MGVEPDFNQPQTSPVAPPPQGPPPGWRPLSGLALTAFIVSLLLGMAAFVSGAWWLAVVAALLSLAGFLRAVPARFRGRGFAITGLVISITFGFVAYQTQASFRGTAVRLASSVMRVLDADIAEDVRAERLRDWLHPAATEAGEIDKLRTRWADLVAKMGPYKQGVVAGSTFGGHMGVWVGPQDPALVQSDDPSRGLPDAGTSVGKMVWARAAFEKGTVHVALHFEGKPGEGLEAVGAGGTTPVLSTVLFYVPDSKK